MPSVLPPVAVLPEFPSLSEVIGFQVSGLLVVFLALGSIWFAVDLVGRIFIARAARQAAALPAAATPATASASTPLVPDDGVPPEIVALITAAVHVTLGTRARVTHVKPTRIDGDWAREGRRQIFASHRVR